MTWNNLRVGSVNHDSELEDLSKFRRPIISSVYTYYYLDGLKTALMDLPKDYATRKGWPLTSNPKMDAIFFRHAGVPLEVQEVTRLCHVLARQYSEQLARNMFDYIVLACFGEARHARGVLYAGRSAKSARNEQWLFATKFAPELGLPYLVRIFKEYRWNGSFGGTAWANIAEAGLKWFTTYRDNPYLFVDNCVNLSHNGGLAFNKEVIFTLQNDPISRYMRLLDFKRVGLLHEMSQKDYRLYVTSNTWDQWIALQLGLQKVGSRIRQGEFPEFDFLSCLPPYIAWGSMDPTWEIPEPADEEEEETRRQEEEDD